MNSRKRIALSPEETLSEITSILARGYLRYRKCQESSNKTGDYQRPHTKEKKIKVLTKNNLISRSTNAFVQTRVNKNQRNATQMTNKTKAFN